MSASQNCETGIFGRRNGLVMANIHKKRNIRTVSMAAMVLAAALFSAGCGSGTTETAESGTAETEVSNAASTLEGEEPVFDYYQNGNKITKEEYSSRIQEYENDIAAGFDWIKKKRES